jgi:hypothetical protein
MDLIEITTFSDTQRHYMNPMSGIIYEYPNDGPLEAFDWALLRVVTPHRVTTPYGTAGLALNEVQPNWSVSGAVYSGAIPCDASSPLVKEDIEYAKPLTFWDKLKLFLVAAGFIGTKE